MKGTCDESKYQNNKNKDKDGTDDNGGGGGGGDVTPKPDPTPKPVAWPKWQMWLLWVRTESNRYKGYAWCYYYNYTTTVRALPAGTYKLNAQNYKK